MGPRGNENKRVRGCPPASICRAVPSPRFLGHHESFTFAWQFAIVIIIIIVYNSGTVRLSIVYMFTPRATGRLGSPFLPCTKHQGGKSPFCNFQSSGMRRIDFANISTIPPIGTCSFKIDFECNYQFLPVVILVTS